MPAENQNEVSETVTAADVGDVPAIIVDLPPERIKAPRATALYNELKQAEAKLEAELAPAREYYEKHVNDPKYIAACAAIRRLSNELFDIKNDLAAMARLNPRNKSLQVEGGQFAKLG